MENNENKDNKEKTINRLHLIYGYIISALLIVSIILLWILSSRGVVSQEAFQNFSFAASIASIILAVVSIVFTIYSGAGSTAVLVSTEQSIREQIEELDGIEERIVKVIERGNNKITDKIEETKNSLDALNTSNVISNVAAENVEESHTAMLNLSINSVLGNMLLYICLKSIATHKAWKLDILGNENKSYFQGYLVAMTAISSMSFTYTTDNDFSEILDCSFNKNIGLDSNDIVECMQKRPNWGTIELEFKKIDDYFSK